MIVLSVVILISIMIICICNKVTFFRNIFNKKKRYLYASIVIIDLFGIGMYSLHWFKQKYLGINSLSSDGWACFIGAAIPSIVSLIILWINRLDNEEAQRKQDGKHKDLMVFQLQQQKRLVVNEIAEHIANFSSQINIWGIKCQEIENDTEIEIDDKCFKELDRVKRFHNLIYFKLNIIDETDGLLEVLFDIKEEMRRFDEAIDKICINNECNEYKYFVNKEIAQAIFGNIGKHQLNLLKKLEKFADKYINNINELNKI